MTSTSRSEATFSSSGKLGTQAASAALNSSRDSPLSKSKSHPLLDEDGKLSAAGAATSLKYAKAHELPSFPSAGLQLSSAGAAASLADSNKKSFQHWKPAAIPAASKAADLAKDYQMNPLWQPEASKAGNSAAGQALKMKPPGAITERESPADSMQKARLAATLSMSGNRRRADSAPLRPQKDSVWALKAAQGSQRNQAQQAFTTGDPGFEAARIQNRSKDSVPRSMYGSTPPVAIEVEERNRQATLKASSVAMAQKMYAIQQSHIDEAKAASQPESRSAAASVQNRDRSGTASSVDEETANIRRFPGLEEAAKKLAMERLARLHDEHAEYRQYYGPTTPAKSRVALRGFRRRASSDGQQIVDSDEEKSRKIKNQMSLFQSQLAAIDSKKKQSDRDAVMAQAYKNVTKTMANLDEKVFQDTGKQSPHQKTLWEKEAKDRAQKDSATRMLNHGKVHIGGGRYMDQSEIDAIARARLQPTLDEISEKAEAQRARDEEIRIEEERKKREIETEKTKQAQIKADERAEKERVKAIEKARKDEEKRVQKEGAAAQREITNAEKEKARAEAAERKEKARAEAAAEKEEKKKSRDPKSSRFGTLLGTAGVGGAAASGASAIPTSTGEGLAPGEELEEEGKSVDSDGDAVEAKVGDNGTKDDDGVEENRFVSSLPGEEGWKETAEEPENTPASPTSPTKKNSKVKTWLKSRFRTGSKSQKDLEDEGAFPYEGMTEGTRPDIEEEKETDSVRDVAMAGKTPTIETDDMYGASEREAPVSPVRDEAADGHAADGHAADGHAAKKSESISAASSLYSKEPSKPLPVSAQTDPEQSSDPPRGRRGFNESKANAVNGLTASKGGEVEDPDEARDTFEEEKLAPPPMVSTLVGDDTKALSPKGSREGSKFKEDL